jgi:hypothetical protein
VIANIALSGSTVYLGGSFTNIGGKIINWLAAIDSTTGIATSWNPNADGPIKTLFISGTTIYVGGGGSF